jgi:hypothetical protein
MSTLDELSAKLDALLARSASVDRRFLPVDGSANYCGISPESIRRLAASGKLTPLRPVKGRVVFDIRELESYVLGCDSRPRSGRGLR